MKMEITARMRKKYRARFYGRNKTFDRRPAGGNDVVQLCDTADELYALVLELQRRLPDADSQNYIQRKLWSVSA